MEILKNIFIFGFLIFFPIYFWWYIFSLFGGKIWGLRMRFFSGIILGIFSVGIIFLLTRFFQNFSLMTWVMMILFFLIIVYFLILFFTRKRHRMVAHFLKKISVLHGLLVSFFLIVFAGIFHFFPDNFAFFASMIVIFFSAFFEEIAKHFTMLGLMGKYYSFSLRDITIFSFCIVLGFVFIENIFYLISYNFSPGVLLLRSIFYFSAHLASAMIAVLFWWKALSYRFASWQYIFCFALGLLASVLCHTFFNYAMTLWKNIFMLFYLVGAYGLFVYGFKK